MNSNEQKEPTFTVDQIAEYLKQTGQCDPYIDDPEHGIEQYFNDRQHDKLGLVLYLQGGDLYSCEIVNEHKETIAVLHKGTLQEAIEGSIPRVVRLLEHLLNLREKHC
jgi:hypothetical protein